MKSFLLAFFCMMCAALPANASHIMGGDITVSPAGIPGKYRVRVVYYRDTAGIYGDSIIRCYLYQQSGSSFTPLAVDVLPKKLALSSPVVTNAPAGTDVFTFDTVLAYTFTPGNYRVVISHCCRNFGITNASNPAVEGEALTADFIVPPMGNDATPEFLAMPVVYTVINTPWNYNPLPFDADGDSLVWSVTNPYNEVDTNSGIAPLIAGWTLPPAAASGPFSLNPITGELTWTPNALGITIASFTIKEYRNGINIGKVDRDMQYIVTSGISPLPFFSPSTSYNINTAANYNWTSYIPGQPFQFTVKAVSTGTPGTMECMSGLFKSAIQPAFSTSQSGPDTVVGNFVWIPPANQTRDEIVVFRVRSGSYTRDFTLLLRKGDPPVTGIPEVSLLQDLRVFPNPAGSLLHVDFKTNIALPLRLELTDMTGKNAATLYNGAVQKGNWKMQFDLKCATGVYMLQAVSGNTVVATQRVSVL